MKNEDDQQLQEGSLVNSRTTLEGYQERFDDYAESLVHQAHDVEGLSEYTNYMLEVTSSHPKLSISTRLRKITAITGLAMARIRRDFLPQVGSVELHNTYATLWAQSIIEHSKLPPDEQVSQSIANGTQ